MSASLGFVRECTLRNGPPSTRITWPPCRRCGWPKIEYGAMWSVEICVLGTGSWRNRFRGRPDQLTTSSILWTVCTLSSTSGNVPTKRRRNSKLESRELSCAVWRSDLRRRLVEASKEWACSSKLTNRRPLLEMRRRLRRQRYAKLKLRLAKRWRTTCLISELKLFNLSHSYGVLGFWG